jgi:transcription initiation factor TFIID subunit 7
MLERNLLRDKTLVLRILDERLQSHLREKMAALDEKSNQEASASSAASNSKASASLQNNVNAGSHATSTSTQNINNSEGRIFDLEGVTCEPAIQTRTPSSSSFLDDNMHKSSEDQAQAGAELLDQHTLWNFHCDGATYPARLINLPCPIEIHKTHDHAMYYKCVDIAQMLIVYEDMTELEEAESMPGYKNEGFPSYYHSGLTPPLTKVVQRRFMQREHADVPPPMNEVIDVEKDLITLIEAISTKDPNKRAGRGNHSAHRSMQTKVLEEVEDEVVEYEPWMDNYGKEPKGIEFDETDAICKKHPELWLDPEELRMPSIVDESANFLFGGVGAGAGGDKTSTGKIVKENKKKKSSTGSGADKPEKKTKKKKSKKKEAAPALPISPPPIETVRPLSTNPELDALNIDQFDLDLEGFGEDFDMDGIVD